MDYDFFTGTRLRRRNTPVIIIASIAKAINAMNQTSIQIGFCITVNDPMELKASS